MIRRMTTDFEGGFHEVEFDDGRLRREPFSERMARDPVTIRRHSFDPSTGLLSLVLPAGDPAELEIGTSSTEGDLAGRPVIYLDQNHWITLARMLWSPSKVKSAAVLEAGLRLIAVANGTQRRHLVTRRHCARRLARPVKRPACSRGSHGPGTTREPVRSITAMFGWSEGVARSLQAARKPADPKARKLGRRGVPRTKPVPAPGPWETPSQRDEVDFDDPADRHADPADGSQLLAGPDENRPVLGHPARTLLVGDLVGKPSIEAPVEVGRHVRELDSLRGDVDRDRDCAQEVLLQRDYVGCLEGEIADVEDSGESSTPMSEQVRCVGVLLGGDPPPLRVRLSLGVGGGFRAESRLSLYVVHAAKRIRCL
jgi:hypothetical protein